jgi:uncharacterized membrane protein YadS
MTVSQYGMLAGMTVYAVPQVMAATLPIGALANQIGTIVKLVRVLMLAPGVLVLSLLSHRFVEPLEGATGVAPQVAPIVPSLQRLVPWFIVGFLVMGGLRTLGVIPVSWLASIKSLTVALTIVSMAALGLTVDVREVSRAGIRVSVAVTLSLLLLIAMTLGFILLFVGRVPPVAA